MTAKTNPSKITQTYIQQVNLHEIKSNRPNKSLQTKFTNHNIFYTTDKNANAPEVATLGRSAACVQIFEYSKPAWFLTEAVAGRFHEQM